jgi:hypothetical protein
VQGRDRLAVGGLGAVPPAGGVQPAVVKRIALVVSHLDAATGMLRADRIQAALDFAAAPARLSIEFRAARGPRASASITSTWALTRCRCRRRDHRHAW